MIVGGGAEDMVTVAASTAELDRTAAVPQPALAGDAGILIGSMSAHSGVAVQLASFGKG